MKRAIRAAAMPDPPSLDPASAVARQKRAFCRLLVRLKNDAGGGYKKAAGTKAAAVDL